MDVDERAREIERINEQLAEVRGSARSTDGSVAIETDVTGRITYLYLADYAMDNGPDRLAAMIADRHRAAQSEAEATAHRIFEAADDHRRGSSRPLDTGDHYRNRY